MQDYLVLESCSDTVCMFFYSSRLQPEHYRRLLGSTNRTNNNLNTDSNLLTIDREPSSHLPEHSDSGTNSGDPCDNSDNDDNSGEGDEEYVERLNSSVEETTGIRYRGRRTTAQRSDRELGKRLISKVCC